MFLLNALLLLVSAAAQVNYHLEEGNRATTWEAREREWNQALGIGLEKMQNTPYYELNPSLLQSMAFLYQEMGQTPLAILYLERARRLKPFDMEIKNELKRLRREGGIPLPKKDPFLMSAFATLTERGWKVIGLLLALTTTSLIAWRILTKRKKLKKTTAVLATVTVALFIALAVKEYLFPITAVVMEPTLIYTEGSALSTSLDHPLLPGELVKVTSISSDEEWFQILTDDERLGFIPIEAIRPVK